MKRFEYLEARTVRQVISMLQRYGENARIVAGSTDFLVRWRQGLWNPEHVINIQLVAGLGRITYSSGPGRSPSRRGSDRRRPSPTPYLMLWE